MTNSRPVLPESSLPDPLRAEVERLWADYLARATEEELAALAESPTVLDSLPGVWACSPFTAKYCVQQPGEFAGLLRSGALTRACRDAEYREKLHDLPGDLNEADYLRALRLFRQREMVRVAWRDLAGWADLPESFRDLSDLADALVNHAGERLYQELTRRFGTPSDAEGRPQPLVILAMGKLGGQELNFSSDIDLIFTYPEVGETQGANKTLTNQEFFIRLGQKLINCLNTVTADGFVLRVDMRLRPFGESGPLAISFSALEDYYLTHAREWERYALIKARVINNAAEHEPALLGFLRPFVFRRYLDFGAFEALRDLKQQIDQEMRRRGREQDIKLGIGGIREIEFICQVFQLIRGGRQPALQTQHLLTTLEQLREHGQLPPETVSSLREAYLFLRRTEQHLQAIDDKQTQCLPVDEINRTRLAWSLGFEDWDSFMRDLEAHQQQVHAYFREVISAPDESDKSQGRQADFGELWADPGEGAFNLRLLTDTGFQNPPVALELLRRLKESYALRQLSRKGQERLDTLMPVLLETLTHYRNQDIALERALTLVEAIARRSVYLALLIEHPQALNQVVKLFADSEWIAGQVARYPLLLDGMLDPRRLYDALNPAELDNAIQSQLAHLAMDDLEMQMDTLRHFKRAQVLHVAAGELSGQISVEVASDYLTALADSMIKQALAMAWSHLTQQYGQPICQDQKGNSRPAGFCIVAYGKAGAIEMSYSSDLDIVFLHDSRGDVQATDGLKQIDNNVFFARLAKRIIHLLTTQTAGGVLYEVDARLRPGGNSGLMVSSLEAFQSYQQQEAWTWEHQALVRARSVAGDPNCMRRFEQIRREVLTAGLHEPDNLRADILDMRRKMRENLDKSNARQFDLKQGEGGIVDIEFIMQYGVLSLVERHPNLLDTTGLLPMLKRLVDAGFLSVHASRDLSEAYRAYRAESHRLALQNQPSYVPAEQFARERDQVRAAWQQLVATEK